MFSALLKSTLLIQNGELLTLPIFFYLNKKKVFPENATDRLLSHNYTLPASKACYLTVSAKLTSPSLQFSSNITST